MTAAKYAAQAQGAQSRSLPRGWTRVPFGEIATLVNGRAYKQEELLQAGTPVLRIQNLNGGDRWYYSNLQLPDDKYCEPGDLLFAWSATFGPYQYSGRRAIFHYHIWRIVCGPSLDKAFAYWLLKEITAEVQAAAHGVAMPHMTKAGMEGWPVHLPPLAEQRRIAATLDQLRARNQRAGHALDEVPGLLKNLRQSILAAAFRGDLTKDWRAKNPDVEPAEKLLQRVRAERRKKWEEAELARMTAKGKAPADDRWKAKYLAPEPIDTTGLPELPHNWCWAGLGELAWDADYGTSEKCDYDGDGEPVLRIPNIIGGDIDVLDMKYALSASARVPGAELLPGDLLFVRTNGSKDLVGRCAVVQSHFHRPHSFASYLIRFRLSVPLPLMTWLTRIIDSPQIRRQIEANAAGSAGQHNISLGNLRVLAMPIPPHDEAMVAATMLAQLRIRMTALSLAGNEANESLERCKRAVLAKAFRGELVPQDPGDEPADVMLARLKAPAPFPPDTSAAPSTSGKRRARPRKP